MYALTGAVALLLGLASAPFPTAGSVPIAGPPQPDLPSAIPISVTMTTHNDGRVVSLLDPAHPAWAHLAPTGAVAEVTATVELNDNSIHQWVAHLDTPDAFQGVTPADCRGDEEAPPKEVSCDYAVQAASGVNRLEFHFSADNGRVHVDAEGTIRGGQFDWDVGWEVLDATGQWSAIARDQTIALPATMSSALRYVVTNTGDIPFRVTNGCDDQLLPSHAQLVCLERGVRPVQSLARTYTKPLLLADVVNTTAEPSIQMTIRSFAGVFSLDESSVIVGQPVVVHATGLPQGSSFALQFRIDNEAVLVGAQATKTGSSRLEFPLPSTSPGTAHLRIEHDGITIANLPFDVTLVPRPPDAAAPVWPWLLLLIPLVGLIVLLRIRVRRSRAPRAQHRPDPYPDATPATPEPEAARRS
ncbi:MAG TPA: hypothetical protein VGM38_06355 [Pseudolysinimonas sp.]